MHFQSGDEEPGSSESTAERGERKELFRHFVPINMLRGGGGKLFLEPLSILS